MLQLGMRPPDKACDTNPLSGFAEDASDSRLRVPVAGN